MSETERRAFGRLGLPFKGTVTFFIEGQEVRSEIQTKDISVSGGYFMGDTCPVIGDQVTLFLQWPPDKELTEITLNTTGTVQRVEQLSEKQYGFAVEFKKKSNFEKM